jgi:hypothetical protein
MSSPSEPCIQLPWKFSEVSITKNPARSKPRNGGQAKAPRGQGEAILRIRGRSNLPEMEPVSDLLGDQGGVSACPVVDNMVHLDLVFYCLVHYLNGILDQISCQNAIVKWNIMTHTPPGQTAGVIVTLRFDAAWEIYLLLPSGSDLANSFIFKRICLHSRKISALNLVFLAQIRLTGSAH